MESLNLDLSLSISSTPIEKHEQCHERTDGKMQVFDKARPVHELGTITNASSSYQNVASIGLVGKPILQINKHLEYGKKLEHNSMHGLPHHMKSAMKNEVNVGSSSSSAARRPTCRKLPSHWTPQEHELFLKGLKIYGRGQWKNISKNFVQTRSPSQVSSHAQSYFKRTERSKQHQRNVDVLQIDNCTTSKTIDSLKSSASTILESENKCAINPRPTLNLLPVAMSMNAASSDTKLGL